MKSLERYRALNRLIEHLSYYSGFNPFALSWKFDRHCKSFLIFNIISIVASFHSMWMADTGVDIVKRSVGLGIFVQTLAKGFLIIWNADVYQQLIADVERLYRSKKTKTMAVMEKTVGIAERIYKLITLVNSSAVMIFIAYPFVAILIFDKMNLMFPFFLPWLNPYDYFGFVVNSIFHAILLVYTLLFHNAFDIAFASFTLHVVAMAKLIEADYEELTEFAEECKNDSDADTKFVAQKLKSTIETQNELDRYVEKLNRFYAWPCFVTSSTSIFSICIALVLIIIIGWPLAYGLCWALFGQIFAAYINGEVVNYQYERLNKFVYGFPWYKLRVSEQKIIQIMIHKSQRPKNMMILFTGPLKLETFTIICNAIYTYFNVCKTLLENENRK